MPALKRLVGGRKLAKIAYGYAVRSEICLSRVCTLLSKIWLRFENKPLTWELGTSTWRAAAGLGQVRRLVYGNYETAVCIHLGSRFLIVSECISIREVRYRLIYLTQQRVSRYTLHAGPRWLIARAVRLHGPKSP